MADRKISQLSVATAAQVADDDYIPFVDVSETDPLLKNKRVAIGEISKRLSGRFLALSGSSWNIESMPLAERAVTSNFAITTTGAFLVGDIKFILFTGNNSYTGTINGTTVPISDTGDTMVTIVKKQNGNLYITSDAGSVSGITIYPLTFTSPALGDGSIVKTGDVYTTASTTSAWANHHNSNETIGNNESARLYILADPAFTSSGIIGFWDNGGTLPGTYTVKAGFYLQPGGDLVRIDPSGAYAISSFAWTAGRYYAVVRDIVNSKWVFEESIDAVTWTSIDDDTTAYFTGAAVATIVINPFGGDPAAASISNPKYQII